MIKDITIGQYFPGTSFIHKLDPRSKIIMTIFYMVFVFFVENIVGFGYLVLVVILLYAISEISLKMVIKNLKPLIPILILTGVLNMLFINGKVLFKFYWFNITDKGLELAIFMVLRILILISISSLLTYTTSPIILTDAIESLLLPLKKIKFPVHELSMMMSISIRFIPTLIEEMDKIMVAQKSRGSDFESGGLIKRAKSLIPILIPLFVSAFRRADDLSLAMESRCYNGGEGRTKMKRLKYTYYDAIGYCFCLISIGIIILLNIYF